MKITFALPFLNLTGGIRLLLDYANWLHANGHEVTVIHPSWPYRFHFSRRQQFDEWRRNLRGTPGGSWADLRCRVIRVPFVANAVVPDADVIVATAWPVIRDVARLGPSKGAKVHVLFHHEAGTGPETSIANTYAMPFHRISFAQAVRTQMRDRFHCDVHDVIPAAIDTTRFFPDGVPKSDRVLMLYHNDPRKGASDGIEALTLLRARRSELDVRMCGTVVPPCLPSWIPYQLLPDDAALRRLYSTSCVLLYPSLDEGFGLPPLEAMACRCAVVTTAVGAVPEFAVDRQNAVVVRPGDIEAMATGLDELLSNSQLRSGIAERGSQTAERYALTNSAPRFEAALLKATTPLSHGRRS